MEGELGRFLWLVRLHLSDFPPLLPPQLSARTAIIGWVIGETLRSRDGRDYIGVVVVGE